MPTRKITIDEVGEVVLYKRRGAKHIRISIKYNGVIRVTMPLWAPYKVGIEFVRNKADWIKSKQIKPEILTTGCVIGKSHKLIFIPNPKNRRIMTKVHNETVLVIVPANKIAQDLDVQVAAQAASLRALKYQAELLLPPRVRAIALQHGFDIKSLKIKQLKSRWGSCTSQGDVVLNYYLMQLPWHLIDYVVIHELMHTRQMSHGPQFWSQLAQYVPDVGEIRKELKQHQPRLLPQNQ